MFHFDPFRVALLAQSLKQQEGRILEEAFSTDKESLFFVFEHGFNLRFNFYKGQFFAQTLEFKFLPKRNRLVQFKEIRHKRLLAVQSYPLDRLFALEFEDELRLVFRLFGKFNQIDLYLGEAHRLVFPASQKHYESLPQNKEVALPQHLEEARKLNPWMTVSDETGLKKLHYDQALNKASLWDSFLSQKRNLRWKAVEQDGEWQLQPSNDLALDFLTEFSIYSRKQLPLAHFRDQQHSLLQARKSVEKRLVKQLQKCEAQSTMQSQQLSFKDQADLIMAYMHQIKAGDKQLLAEHFDGSGPVRISLKAQLSPQANAERYYRKAKNQGKQIAELDKRVKQLKRELKQIHQELETISQAQNTKELKPFIKEAVSKEDKVVLPYRTQYLDGFEIRIGKSAQRNDELLRSYSAPHDMWLHAAGVSGSHVIIRLNKGQELPQSILEEAASIAAYYSKAKSEEFARVIYTYRKFVRKPRNAHPGSVIAEKELSVLVEPMQQKS